MKRIRLDLRDYPDFLRAVYKITQCHVLYISKPTLRKILREEFSLKVGHQRRRSNVYILMLPDDAVLFKLKYTRSA